MGAMVHLPRKKTIKKQTVALLKEGCTSKLPTANLFNVPEKTAKMLHADMEVARQEWIEKANQDPREYKRRQKDDFLKAETYVGVADFHSLRHTAGSLLAATGAHPKVAQSIMRHSDINLTMSLYTHTLRGQEAQAIENLPDLSLTDSKENQKATGTDDRAASASNQLTKNLQKSLPLMGIRCPHLATQTDQNQS
ncbi:tyrosine-type recombinase/integrase [Planctomycetota bacterium]